MAIVGKASIIVLVLAGLWAFLFFWLFDKASPIISVLIAIGIVTVVFITIKIS